MGSTTLFKAVFITILKITILDLYSWFSHDVTAIFVPQNKEVAAMIVSFTNPLGN